MADIVRNTGGNTHAAAGSTAARQELSAFLSAASVDCPDDVATRLFDRFATLACILAADAPALATVAPEAVHVLPAARAMMLSAMRSELLNLPVLDRGDVLLDYLRTQLMHEKREVLRALYLDARLRLIQDDIVSTGTARTTSAPPREIIRRGLEVGAAALILAHNHPSGTATPSRDDIVLTQRIASIAAELDLVLQDHILIAGCNFFSFRAEGLL